MPLLHSLLSQSLSFYKFVRTSLAVKAPEHEYGGTPYWSLPTEPLSTPYAVRRIPYTYLSLFLPHLCRALAVAIILPHLSNFVQLLVSISFSYSYPPSLFLVSSSNTLPRYITITITITITISTLNFLSFWGLHWNFSPSTLHTLNVHIHTHTRAHTLIHHQFMHTT